MRRLFALPLALAACSSEPQPLDGGDALDTNVSAEEVPYLTADTGWRKEPGGWHLSIGHVEPMDPPQKIRGVYVTGFEESSFFPGDTHMPDANDPRRYRVGIELDRRILGAMTGQQFSTQQYKAYALTLVARRTRDLWIDCLGGQNYYYVADRIETVRYLGIMPDVDPATLNAPTKFVRSGQGGRIRALEDQAIERCYGKR